MRAILAKEYKVYVDQLEHFLPQHLNQYVLIKEQKVVGFYDSYEDALKRGLERFGNVPFFVRMVQEVEEMHFFQQGLSA